MDIAPVDYGGMMTRTMAGLPDYLGDMQQRAMISQTQAQTALMGAQVAAKQRQDQQRSIFDQDVGAVLRDPTATNISNLILKHPEYADEIKGAWNVRDKAAQQADLTQLSEVYSAAASGKWDIAAKSARARLEADKAAGQADESDEHIVEMLESADPNERKAALAMIGIQVAGATGPEHFGSVYGALNKGKDGFTLEAGATRFDGEGKIVAQSPFLKGPEGEVLERTAPGSTASVPTNIPGPEGEVASTLASGGMPPAVVAGFLGNFEVEGGYGGAKGDGGSAHGIAQWRNERAANFQRVIGKPVAQTSHAEQAKFVAWEMQNPEAAGMTVEQRDAILNAKNPQQAAALIDQFYERSSGEHRSRRVAAAAKFGGMLTGSEAPAGYKVLVPGKKREAPSGFRWNGDTLEVIPGGPADKKDEPKPRRMTKQEVAAEGLDPNLVYYRNADGVPTVVSGQQTTTAALPKVPGTIKMAYINHNKSIRTIDNTLAQIEKHPGALGGWNKVTPDFVAQRVDPKGVEVRAGVSDVGSLLIHDRSGAAVTISETPRLLPFVPQKSDTPEAAKKKLTRLRNELAAMNRDYVDAYSDENGNSELLKIGRSGGPVRVRSKQEVAKLAPGTLFVAPNGKTYRRK